MELVRKNMTVRRDRAVHISRLPFAPGQRLEITLRPERAEKKEPAYITGKELTTSDIVGLWSKRKIVDSVEYARVLRRKAERRNGASRY